MKAVLIAIAVVATAAPAFAASSDTGLLGKRRPPLQDSPLKACQALTAEKTTDEGKPAGLKRLGDLPPALLEHAVLRSVKGCFVREVVYQGRTVWVQPSIPTVQPLKP